jgi:hypothetical protein
MELVHLDSRQLGALRDAYGTQLSELERTVGEVWNVVEEVYQESRRDTGRDDWDSFSSKVLGGKVTEKRRSWSWFASPEAPAEEGEVQEVKARQWNEITFITPPEGKAIQDNPTLENRMRELKERIPAMLTRLETVFEEKNPTLRQIVEERIEFLSGEFSRFAAQVNPYHIQTGLLLDVDIVTIKRKSTTMMNMANVLNEFLYQVSKGFTDSAFAEFSRRRSTQRTDLEGEFVTGVGIAEVTGAPAAGAEEVFE